VVRFRPKSNRAIGGTERGTSGPLFLTVIESRPLIEVTKDSPKKVYKRLQE